jgi:hypothetical protein
VINTGFLTGINAVKSLFVLLHDELETESSRCWWGGGLLGVVVCVVVVVVLLYVVVWVMLWVLAWVMLLVVVWVLVWALLELKFD